jgi:hypothetical protein
MAQGKMAAPRGRVASKRVHPKSYATELLFRQYHWPEGAIFIGSSGPNHKAPFADLSHGSKLG